MIGENEDKSKNRFEIPPGYKHVPVSEYSQATHVYSPTLDTDEGTIQFRTGRGTEYKWAVREDNQTVQLHFSIPQHGGYCDYRIPLWKIRDASVDFVLVESK